MADRGFKQVNRLFSRLKALEEDAQFLALEGLQSAMKRRIFQKGEATDNSPLGSYRSAWKKVREKEDFQTAYKDLQFTGTLIKSIVVGRSGGKNVLGFLDPAKSPNKKLNTPMRVIAAGQESKAQVGKKIFTPSREEIDEMVEVYLQELGLT